MLVDSVAAGTRQNQTMPPVVRTGTMLALGLVPLVGAAPMLVAATARTRQDQSTPPVVRAGRGAILALGLAPRVVAVPMLLERRVQRTAHPRLRGELVCVPGRFLSGHLWRVQAEELHVSGARASPGARLDCDRSGHDRCGRKLKRSWACSRARLDCDGDSNDWCRRQLDW